jgi:phosphoribosyl-ATP pyrophosphohydrolase/phosphoribosyl-AMP cyclohydrolase
MTGPRAAATLDPGSIRYGADGLVPVVVQDVADGRVLMVAYADAEAVAATLETGDLHFHSRSRGRLWWKGETSGHLLRLHGLALDCDSDALLATAEPVGPTCHRRTRSCFDPDGAAPDSSDQGFAWLERLWATIADRAASRPEGSYTGRLVAGGVDVAGRKVTEEATEVLLAARDDAEAERADADRTAVQVALAGEAADLLYHLLVLLAERRVEPSAVIGTLRDRHRT